MCPEGVAIHQHKDRGIILYSWVPDTDRRERHAPRVALYEDEWRVSHPHLPYSPNKWRALYVSHLGGYQLSAKVELTDFNVIIPQVSCLLQSLPQQHFQEGHGHSVLSFIYKYVEVANFRLLCSFHNNATKETVNLVKLNIFLHFSSSGVKPEKYYERSYRRVKRVHLENTIN